MSGGSGGPRRPLRHHLPPRLAERAQQLQIQPPGGANGPMRGFRCRAGGLPATAARESTHAPASRQKRWPVGATRALVGASTNPIRKSSLSGRKARRNRAGRAPREERTSLVREKCQHGSLETSRRSTVLSTVAVHRRAGARARPRVVRDSKPSLGDLEQSNSMCTALEV